MKAGKKKVDSAKRSTTPAPGSSISSGKWRTPAEPNDFEKKLSLIDWKDLELFQDVADAGSLRAGAVKTRHALGTIRRRLARIEDKLGELIATRDPLGLQLTAAGKRLLGIAREMRRSRLILESERETGEDRDRIRIAVTEGLGTYWLMPRLVELQQAHPELDIELQCDMQRSDVAGGECDIAIQLERPADPGAICERLGCLHLMPFASDRYLRAAGVPQSVDDWPKHRLVWQEADQVAFHLLPFILGTTETDGLIAIRTNSSSAHFRAIATGGGIGILPTYARAVSRRVRPLDLNVQLRREILCVSSATRRPSPEVELALAWLRSSFDGEVFPWFRDQFVHPRDFEETLSSPNVITLFEGFIDNLDVDGG